MTTRKSSSSRSTRASKRTTMSRHEAAKKAAAARWGKTGHHSSSHKSGKKITREEAGRRGAEARWGRVYEPAHHGRTSYSSSTKRMSREESGRLGAEARWGKAHSNRIPSHSRTSTYRTTSARLSKPATTGHKRAETSWQHVDKRRTTRSSHRSSPGHMSRQEAGRLGAEARWGGHYPDRYTSHNGRSTRASQPYTQRAVTGRRGTASQRTRSYSEPQTRYSHPYAPYPISREEVYYRGIDARKEQGRRKSNHEPYSSSNHFNGDEASRRGGAAHWGHHAEDEYEPNPQSRWYDFEPYDETDELYDYDLTEWEEEEPKQRHRKGTKKPQRSYEKVK